MFNTHLYQNKNLLGNFQLVLYSNFNCQEKGQMVIIGCDLQQQKLNTKFPILEKALVLWLENAVKQKSISVWNVILGRPVSLLNMVFSILVAQRMVGKTQESKLH